MIAYGGTLGLAEGIIDDTCSFSYLWQNLMRLQRFMSSYKTDLVGVVWNWIWPQFQTHEKIIYLFRQLSTYEKFLVLFYGQVNESLMNLISLQ